MSPWLIRLFGWLVTSAVLLTAYNLAAYGAGWHLPFWANVLVGVAAGLIGMLVGEIAVNRAYARRMRKVMHR